MAFWRRTRVVIRETDTHRELWLVRGRKSTLQSSARLDDPLVSGIPYTDGFHLYPPARGARVLMVGGGAGIGARQLALFHGADVDIAEHDAAVVAAARASFGLDGVRVQVIDGRAAIERSAAGSLDMIVVDAFGAGVYPGRLATVEMFALCRDRLREPGTLVVNLAGLPASVAPIAAGIVAAFGAGVTRLYGVPGGGNSIAVAFRGQAPPLAPRGHDQLPHLPGIARRPLPLPEGADPLHDAGVPALLPIHAA